MRPNVRRIRVYELPFGGEGSSGDNPDVSEYVLEAPLRGSGFEHQDRTSRLRPPVVGGGFKQSDVVAVWVRRNPPFGEGGLKRHECLREYGIST
jgi:hypothetical protein